METESTPEATESTGDQIIDRIMATMEPEAPRGDEPQDEAELSSDEQDSDEEQPDESMDEDGDTASLAELLGISEDQITVNEDGSIQISTKVDGETAQVSLPELVKGYQLNKAITQRSQALAEEKRAFDEAKTQLTGQLQAEVQRAQGLAQYMQQQLMAELQNVNWDELRQIDPAEYAAKKYDAEKKQAELAQVMTYAQQMQAHQQQQMQAEQLQAQQQILAQQRDVMLNNNPTWRDPDVLARDMGQMRDFVTRTYGFSNDDLETVSDARLIELIKDAKAYRDGRTVAEKKRVTAPRLQKPGTPKANVSQARQQRDAIRKRGGSLTDVAAYLESHVI